MNVFDFIIDSQSIIFPVFYTLRDSENNEYVFLKTGEVSNKTLDYVSDKTQLEAFENHVHLFEKVKKKHRQKALDSARLIASNLAKELRVRFPDKRFHVFLDCDFPDHAIIRFHQHWEGEPAYYNTKEFSTIEEIIVG